MILPSLLSLRPGRGLAIALALTLAPMLTHGQDKVAEDYLQADKLVTHASAANHVRLYARDGGQGEAVVILPSLGRGVEDYTEQYRSSLTTRLAEAGYQVLLIQPRGIGKSSGDLTPQHASMSLFAQDIRNTLNTLGIQRAHFIGHAFGNRLARTYATLFPDQVEHLVLIASGGNFALSEAQKECLFNSFNLELADEVRLKFIHCAFFARTSDPQIWLNGWHPALAEAQIMAARMMNGDFFKRAGGKPFLLVQAAEDFIAPPEKAGWALKAELGDQITYVEIPGTGHALSSERPDLIAQYILEYLGKKGQSIGAK